MNQALQAKLSLLINSDLLKYIPGIKRGFEKECLRVDKEGALSQTPHPYALGSSLMHPMITTDYSEALLEFITPPLENIDLTFKKLHELHQFTDLILAENTEGEYLWPASMPCLIPKEEEIPLAQYGSSNLGKMKTIYRNGLGLRYNRRMQTIAGIHYNFSLPKSFWQALQTNFHHSSYSLNEYISEQYLAMIRNVMRLGWFLPLLFGASPAVCASFVKTESNLSIPNHLEMMQNNTLYAPYATSLRLSDLGYHNKKQIESAISYNSLQEFIKSMHDAVHTLEPEFAKLGVFENGEYRQLSACRLQIEDEHYAMIRPKRVTLAEERLLSALQREGIEYLEIRALDIDPRLNLGITPEAVYILDTFLMLCLLLDSPIFTAVDEKIIRFNYQQVVNLGRKPELKLKTRDDQFRSLKECIAILITDLQQVAELLDKANGTVLYTKAIEKSAHDLNNMNQLPSARILAEMQDRNDSYFTYVKRYACQHTQYFRQENPLTKQEFSFYQQMAVLSHQDQKLFEQKKEEPFSVFLQKYLAV